MTDDELRAIEERAKKATPPPWIRKGSCIATSKAEPGTWDLCVPGRDGEFVTHAREDVPKLCAEVRRLNREIMGMENLVCPLVSEEDVKRLLENIAGLEAERDRLRKLCGEVAKELWEGIPSMCLVEGTEAAIHRLQAAAKGEQA